MLIAPWTIPRLLVRTDDDHRSAAPVCPDPVVGSDGRRAPREVRVQPGDRVEGPLNCGDAGVRGPSPFLQRICIVHGHVQRRSPTSTSSEHQRPARLDRRDFASTSGREFLQHALGATERLVCLDLGCSYPVVNGHVAVPAGGHSMEDPLVANRAQSLVPYLHIGVVQLPHAGRATISDGCFYRL